MKILKIGFIISLFLNFFLALSLVKEIPVSVRKFEPTQPFSITNLNGSVSNSGYIVAFQDGRYWWTIDENVISLNIGVHQGVTLRIDKDSGRVKSTTIELYGTNDQHCYFTDFNADGIPDKKWVGGDENWQVFYAGEFVPSFAQGTNRYIVKNGANLLVHFNGSRWEAVK